MITLVAVFSQAGLLDERLVTGPTVDTWFDADIGRVVANISDRWSNQFRAKVHPLHAALLYPPVLFFDRLLGFGTWTSVKIVVAAVAGAKLAALYAFLRLVGCVRSDALLGSGLAAASAAAVFWFAVPETHPFGALSFALALVLVAAARHRTVPAAATVAVSALTLGITVTNWMAGVLATLFVRRLRKAVLLSLASLATVILLWAIARQVMPSLPFMFAASSREAGFVFAPESRGPGAVAMSFFSHTMVMPAIDVIDRPGGGQWPAMTIQTALPGSSGWLGIVAVILWAALLALGIASVARAPAFERLRWFLLSLIGAQLALYMVFGTETFLYAPNWLPLLIAVAASPLVTDARRAGRVLIIALIVTAGANNVIQWRRANGMVVAYEPMRFDPQGERERRPGDRWPREERPDRLAEPGWRVLDTGFHAQGGSFSPGLDQFGIALWVVDPAGDVIVTSDGLDPTLFEQRERGATEAGAVAIRTTARWYHSEWSIAGPRRFRLDLSVPEGPNRVVLAVRAAGPSGGPIRSLDWNGERLLINDRWSISSARGGMTALLGDERAGAWPDGAMQRVHIDTPAGWGWAILDPESGDLALIVEDLEPTGPTDRHLARLR